MSSHNLDYEKLIELLKCIDYYGLNISNIIDIYCVLNYKIPATGIIVKESIKILHGLDKKQFKKIFNEFDILYTRSRKSYYQKRDKKIIEAYTKVGITNLDKRMYPFYNLNNESR